MLTAYYMGGAYEVTGSAVKKYYSVAGMMVATQDASGLQYLLTDHLGSTVAVTNGSGTLTSQQRYLPFGAVRTIPNSPILGTDFGYTGQRMLDSGMGGIMDYKASFYAPYLNRFLQPDSVIPDPANPQSWNRFSYVENRPVNATDPTGHMILCDEACEHDNEPAQPLSPEPQGGGGGGGDKDEDDDGYPEIPDPSYPSVPTITYDGCDETNLVECFYARERPYFDNGVLDITQAELNMLYLAVFFDIKHRDRGTWDRFNYDTPLWDGWGGTPGSVCIRDICYDRPEVNYFAQGMYSAAEGESLQEGKEVVYDYKELMHTINPGTYPSATPSAGTLYWFEQGYNAFVTLNQ